MLGAAAHRFGARGISACIDRERGLDAPALCFDASARTQLKKSFMDPKVIDDLARRLAAAVPESVSALGRDLEQNFRSVLQAGLARLDLVTRTDFDVQVGVLKRTREMIEALEKRVRELEAELEKKKTRKS